MKTERRVRLRMCWAGPRAGVFCAAVVAALVVVHGALLPQYVRNVKPQPGVLRIAGGTDIALQWHEDARIEMEGARDFPRSLSGRAGARRNRPLYCAVGSVLYRCVRPLAGAAAATQDDQARLAGWCLLATNLAYLALAVTLFSDAVRRWFGAPVAAASVLLLLSTRFLHRYAAVCVTHAYIHLPPAVLLALAVRWVQRGRVDDRRGAAAAAGWGALFGVFYLFKQNVAVAASLVGVLLLLRQWRSAAACVAALPVPYGVYRALLAAAGISYGNQEVERYRQGVWVLDALGGGRFGGLFASLWHMLVAMPAGLRQHFGWVLPAAALGAWLLWRRRRDCPREAAGTLAFTAVLGACALVQTYGSRRHGVSYIWAELYVLFCPLAALALTACGDWASRRWPRATVARWAVPAGLTTAYALWGYRRLTLGGAVTAAQTVCYALAVAALSTALLASAAVSRPPLSRE